MAKKALALTMVVVALGAAAWVLARPEPLSIPAPAYASSAPPEVESLPSHAQVELRFGIQGLQAALNARAPKQFGARIANPTSALTEDTIRWNLKLETISLGSSDGALSFVVPFRGRASLEGRFGVRRRNGGLLGELEDALSESFSETVNIGGEVHGTLRPVLRPDWTIDPNLSVRVNLSQAEARLFGRAIRVSFRDAIESEVNAAATAFVAKANKHIASDATIRREVKKGWDALHQVIRVYESPAVFVTLKPLAFGASDPVVTQDDVVLRLAASMDTAVRVGHEPPNEAASDIPALSQVADDGDGFSLAVPVAVELSSLQAVGPEELGLPSAFDTAVGHVRLQRLSLLGDGRVLYLAADLEAHSDWYNRVAGTVYLAGTPVLDEEQGLLRLEGLRFDTETSSYLVDAASFLLEPVVLAELNKRALFNVRSMSDELVAASRVELATMKESLPAGIELDAHISHVGVSKLVVDDGWLVVVAEGTGAITIRATQLESLVQ